MNQSGYADLKNTSTVEADEVVIGNLILPNLDPNSVPYIAGDNSLQDQILNNGQVLVGVTSGAPIAASLTGTMDEIIVTNGPGSITLATPQPIATTSSPTFANINLSNNVSGPTYTRTADNIISCSTSQTTNNLVSICFYPFRFNTCINNFIVQIKHENRHVVVNLFFDCSVAIY